MRNVVLKVVLIAVVAAAVWWFALRPPPSPETLRCPRAGVSVTEGDRFGRACRCLSARGLVDPKERRLHPGFLEISRDLRASTPDAVKSVVWLDCDPHEVGKYAGGGAKAYRYYCTATLFDRATGSLAGQEGFVGGDPPDSVKGQTAGFGRMPVAELEKWLRATLKASQP